MIKKIFLTIAIVVLSLASYSQTAVQQAEKAFAAGEYSDAVQLYEVAASTMLGNDTERQKLYDAANKCRDIAAIQTKAENAYKTKNYKTAIGYYDQILKYNPNDPISKTRKNECVYSIRNAEEIAAWKTVVDCQNFADKVANAQKYLNKYPTGRYKKEATEFIEEEVLWQKAVTAKTYDAVSTKQNAEEIVVKDEGVKVFEGEIFKVVEEMPEFPGGAAKMMEFIQKNIQYPMTAQENGIQGRVFVNFVIEPDGSITNVTAMRGIGGGCDEEAIRVVQSMPNWKPGKQRGVAVRTSFMVPVIFK